MNGSPTWKMTKLMSGKCAAAPSMSQVWVASTGWGPSGTPLCTPIRLTPSSWALAVDITGEVHGTDDLVPQPLERRLAWATPRAADPCFRTRVDAVAQHVRAVVQPLQPAFVGAGAQQVVRGGQREAGGAGDLLGAGTPLVLGDELEQP